MRGFGELESVIMHLVWDHRLQLAEPAHDASRAAAARLGACRRAPYSALPRPCYCLRT